MRLANHCIRGARVGVTEENRGLDLPPIYTIGCGSRSTQTLIDELNKNKIMYVIDVRSQPYSRFKPEFNRETFEQALLERKMRYVYMGDLLGGRPAESIYYTDGKVDYAKYWDSPSFQAGVERLKKARSPKFRVALICSEGKPHECHRSKMIGAYLADADIPVVHIDERGQLRGQAAVMALVTRDQPPLNGMEEMSPSTATTSRKRYRPEINPQSDVERWD